MDLFLRHETICIPLANPGLLLYFCRVILGFYGIMPGLTAT